MTAYLQAQPSPLPHIAAKVQCHTLGVLSQVLKVLKWTRCEEGEINAER